MDNVDGWQVAGWIWGGLMSVITGMFAWIGATKIRDLDKLKETCVLQPACDRTTDRMRTDFSEICKRLDDSIHENREETRQGFQATRADFQRIVDRLDRMAEK